MEYSIAALIARSSDADVIFDRCPIGFVAYLVEGQADPKIGSCGPSTEPV